MVTSPSQQYLDVSTLQRHIVQALEPRLTPLQKNERIREASGEELKITVARNRFLPTSQCALGYKQTAPAQQNVDQALLLGEV